MRRLRTSGANWEIQKLLDHDNPWGITSSVEVRSSSGGSYAEASVPLCVARQNTKNMVKQHQEEWAPILDVMES
jgi:hypothetical protein